MNKKRRMEIIKVIKDIEYVVSGILEDEVESYDNIPENLLESSIAETSEEAQESLEAAVELLEEAIVCLEEVL